MHLVDRVATCLLFCPGPPLLDLETLDAPTFLPRTKLRKAVNSVDACCCENLFCSIFNLISDGASELNVTNHKVFRSTNCITIVEVGAATHFSKFWAQF